MPDDDTKRTIAAIREENQRAEQRLRVLVADLEPLSRQRCRIGVERSRCGCDICLIHTALRKVGPPWYEEKQDA
jgi:hypothetical protein